MSTLLLTILAVSLTYFPMSSLDAVHKKIFSSVDYSNVSFIPPILNLGQENLLSEEEIKAFLHKEAPTLSEPVINKVVTSLYCATNYNVEHNNIVTVIDYSLPSSEKRLWVFDLKTKKLLFHTYVSHGIKSGALLTNYFSNKYNSKASSMGVYKTEKAYYGREGLSLRLDGLERSFNDNANNRSVVMHGGWYVEEQFIKKYGRPGRSWGCPALPLAMYQPIINTIKDNSLFIAYYPSELWFVKSKFLNCQNTGIQRPTVTAQTEVLKPLGDTEGRGDVLLADLRKNYNSEGNKAILAMTADNYIKFFHAKAPLERMLRRQIDKVEYIALSTTEFNSLTSKPDAVANKEVLNSMYFIIPVIKMIRGYYETQMQILNFGSIKEVRLNSDPSGKSGQVKKYTIYFEKQPALTLKASDQFIRWVGL